MINSPSSASVYCKGQGFRKKDCRHLVPIDGDHLCAECREAPTNCVICGTGSSYWTAANRCMKGHASLARDYKTRVDLLRERLKYYETYGDYGGAMTWRAAERRAEILAELAQ